MFPPISAGGGTSGVHPGQYLRRKDRPQVAGASANLWHHHTVWGKPRREASLGPVYMKTVEVKYLAQGHHKIAPPGIQTCCLSQRPWHFKGSFSTAEILMGGNWIIKQRSGIRGGLPRLVCLCDIWTTEKNWHRCSIREEVTFDLGLSTPSGVFVRPSVHLTLYKAGGTQHIFTMLIAG